MSGRAAARASTASILRRSKGPLLPFFGDQLTEVKKQLNALNSVFDKLALEYEQYLEHQFAPSRPYATQSTKMEVHEVATPVDVEGQPPNALLDGTHQDVKALIDQKKLSVKQTFRNFRCVGKDFATGTPLAIATLRGDTEMVRVLVEAGAHPDSPYSFFAGAEQREWSGSAINAAIPYGHLEMVRLLVKLEADINTLGSNGANLVWQAAYFNQNAILEYFIERNVQVDALATSQDNWKLRYTPLHVAAMAGHSKSVSILLEARAKHTEEGDGRQPLEDAIQNCHADVVRQLLVARADLFAPVHPLSDIEKRYSMKSDRSSFVSMDRLMPSFVDESENALTPSQLYANSARCIDLVFSSENPVMLSHVAQGLSQSSCEQMCKADFIRFLSGPGDAPCQILEAIFQRFAPRYWEEIDGKRFRMLKTAAFVRAEGGVNVVTGPNYRVLLNAFNRKMVLPPYGVDFMNRLLPQKATRYQNMYVPVTCFMCHIPMLHKDLQVLLAIADCQNDQIFSNEGCQAIINLAWEYEKKLARSRMMVAFFEVLVLFSINVSVNNNLVFLDNANQISLIVWLVALVIELLQFIGYASRGLLKRYLTTWRYWFDFLVLLLTGAVNISLMALADQVATHVQFKTAFGILSFLKWMRFCTFLRQFRQIGINILPITATIWDSGPFGLVLGVYLTGSVNMYYALGLNNRIFDSFLLVYRLVVLGDMNFSEMENELSPRMHINGTNIIQKNYVSADYYEVVRLFVVFVSFLMGLTMMNLFVAILCLAYSEAAEGAKNSWLQCLTGIVLDQRAVRLGARAVLCMRSPNIQEEDPESSGSTLSDDAPVSRSAYVWFALQTDKSL